MKTTLSIILALTALQTATPTGAQTPINAAPGWAFTINRSIVGQQFEKPAVISYTKPSDASGSYAVDIALGLERTFVPTLKSDFVGIDNYQGSVGVFAELHRNTALKKEQNKSIIGLDTRWILNVDAKRNWTLLPDASISNEHDVQAGERGVLTAINLRVRSKPLRMGDLIDVPNIFGVQGPTWFQFWYEPVVGYHRSDVRNSDVGRGHVNRWTAGIDVRVYLPMVEGLVLYYTGNYWRDFAESVALDDGRDKHYYRHFGASYAFNKNVSVGVNRISGENPVEGLAEQKYTQVALQVRF